jgi:diguanylate cyclase
MMLGDNEFFLPGDILNILRDLGVGLTNHSNWVKRLHRSIICHSDIPTDDLASDAERRCEFGKWYYANRDTRLRALPMFDEVGDLHCRVHEHARRLLQLKQSGKDIATEDYDSFTDIAQQFRTAVQSLQFSIFSQVCAVDHLTGVWNRYAMCYKLSQEQERVRRSGKPCSIALIDFDYFKSVNDRYGHLAGDEVLKTAVEFLVSKLRKYDLVFRFGGEEFLFAFPETALDQSAELVDRLREDVKKLDVEIAGGEVISVTVSAGLALLDHESDVNDVIHLADSALMNAKLAGRDCVHVWR